MKETSWNELPREEWLQVKSVTKAVHSMRRYAWWECKCLVSAVAAMKMLSRRGIDCTLYLGTAKDENGQLIAHAWLRSGPYYLTGAKEMPMFTVVGIFGHFSPGAD